MLKFDHNWFWVLKHSLIKIECKLFHHLDPEYCLNSSQFVNYRPCKISTGFRFCICVLRVGNCEVRVWKFNGWVDAPYNFFNLGGGEGGELFWRKNSLNWGKTSRYQELSRKVQIKEYSTCWSIASRSQLMENSTVVIFALLCKNCKCKIPTEQKIGA